MTERQANSDRLDSWKDIASYLGRNVRTVMRWEQGKGLPVHRIPGGKRNAVYAWRHEIDAWLKQEGEDAAEPPAVGQVQLQEGTEFSEAGRNSTLHTLSQREAAPAHIPARASRYTSIRLGILLAAALLVTALAAGGYAFHSRMGPHHIHVTSITQITDDGIEKMGLVSDGREIYFSEHRDGKFILSEVSTQGGQIHEIPTPFIKAVPVDISRDGKNLLVLVWEGDEEAKQLWVVSSDGHQAHPVGQVHCNSAAWSPDGLRIAYAEQNAVYLTNSSGESRELLQAFDGVPHALRWSDDGLWIRLLLRDSKNQTSTVWEIDLTKGEKPKVSSLIPTHIVLGDCCDESIAMDRNGFSLIPIGGNEKQAIYVLKKDTQLLGSRFSIEDLNEPFSHSQATFADPLTDRVYLLGSSAARSDALYTRKDLLSLDLKSKEFRPFLPGIDARDVDFSRVGRKIAYIVQEPRLEIKWSFLDGSKAAETSISAADLELPRWSPDGNSIAFMAKFADKPWRIYIASLVDGRVREASAGSDNQGAPTWSPDGKWLAYGNVRCKETKDCAIHKIELSTGHETVFPGSEGLNTARWSPDGLYVSALRPEKHEVVLFDFATQQWRELATGVNGNDLSWSADSQYIFASRPSGDNPQIVRISISNGHVEEAVDLSSFAKLLGHVDTWFALAPDNAIILQRVFDASEIYSLEYEEK